MPKLYLLGGENVYKRSAKSVNEKAFQDIGRRPNILVFPWARASFDKTYRKRKILSDYFLSLGAGNVEFIEYGQSGVAEKMADAGVVYLTGGQPSILIERIKTVGLDRLLKSYGYVIVGRSAGALALCKRCITTCRSNGKVRVVEGLGLVNITLKTHYTQDKDEILKRFSKNEKIFAIPEGSALVYDKGKLSAVKKVYVFNDGERQVFNEGKL